MEHMFPGGTTHCERVSKRIPVDGRCEIKSDHLGPKTEGSISKTTTSDLVHLSEVESTHIVYEKYNTTECIRPSKNNLESDTTPEKVVSVETNSFG